MSLLSLGGCTRGGCRIWGRLAPFGLARAGSAAGAGQCSAEAGGGRSQASRPAAPTAAERDSVISPGFRCARPTRAALPRLPYPFQRSASVTPAVPLKEPPTAVQAVADAHDTPPRVLPCAGLGVCWIDHVVPFQRSASVPVAVLAEELPTAVQALADVHDTPCRGTNDAPA